MRLALLSLIAVAGVASTAQAQDPAAAPAAPAAAPAPAAEAPPAAAAPAPAPAEPAPPPPTLPTSGYGYDAIQIIEKICAPAVRGGDLNALAKAAGFKLNRRDETWSKAYGAADKSHVAIIYPQYSNKTACIVDLRFPQGQDGDIAKALNVWSFTHEPPLDPTANYTQPVDPDGLKRVRRSWEYLTATQSIGLNFSTVRKPDDTLLNPKFDTATMQYQERKF